MVFLAGENLHSCAGLSRASIWIFSRMFWLSPNWSVSHSDYMYIHSFVDLEMRLTIFKWNVMVLKAIKNYFHQQLEEEAKVAEARFLLGRLIYTGSFFQMLLNFVVSIPIFVFCVVIRTSRCDGCPVTCRYLERNRKATKKRTCEPPFPNPGWVTNLLGAWA